MRFCVINIAMLTFCNFVQVFILVSEDLNIYLLSTQFSCLKRKITVCDEYFRIIEPSAILGKQYKNY